MLYFQFDSCELPPWEIPCWSKTNWSAGSRQWDCLGQEQVYQDILDANIRGTVWNWKIAMFVSCFFSYLGLLCLILLSFIVISFFDIFVGKLNSTELMTPQWAWGYEHKHENRLSYESFRLPLDNNKDVAQNNCTGEEGRFCLNSNCRHLFPRNLDL